MSAEQNLEKLKKISLMKKRKIQVGGFIRKTTKNEGSAGRAGLARRKIWGTMAPQGAQGDCIWGDCLWGPSKGAVDAFGRK